MCKKFIYLTFSFILVLGLANGKVRASDIAISTQANWWGQPAADREMQEIADNVTGASVELFTSAQHAALAAWVQEHTGDDTPDLLIMCGIFPDTIYPAVNAQPDGSLAELFLDDGNVIINTGDYIFFVGSVAINDVGGLSNMMDVPAAAMWGADGTVFSPTDDAQLYTPSYQGATTPRPWFPSQFVGTDWEPELILGQTADGTQLEPAVMVNTVTGGRLGIFYQVGGDNLPRGEVISEWINNWFLMFVASGNPYARKPSPEDGVLLREFIGGVLGTTLRWTPGDFAETHNVYFGDDFDAVNDGTGNTFVVNQVKAYFYVGYGVTSEDPLPGGLVPGTTYYWRIDEVNDTDPNSPWKGDVWSFSIPDTKAYSPNPPDEAQFIDPNVILSWEPGMGGVAQTVYIGEDYDDVNDGTIAGVEVGEAAYYPGPLELDTLYYWRVETFGPTYGQIKGDVWSFKTLPDISITDPSLIGWWKLDEDQGTTALDWSGHGNHGTFVGDPQWVAGYDGDALEFDGTGDFLDCGNDPSLEISGAVSITAWIQVGAQGIDHKVGGNQNNANGGYKMSIVNDRIEFEIRTSDNTAILNRDIPGGTILQQDVWYHVAGIYSQADGYIRTYVNGVLDRELITTEVLGASPGTLYIGCEPYNTGAANFNGVMDDVRLYNKALTQDEIKQTMRGDPLLAWDPNPVNGSTPNINDAVPLTWSPGDNASEHDVYFGTDEDAVDNADTSTPDIYRGRLSNTSYTPPEVEWGGGPYYWRIDEYNTDGTTSKGRVWSFTVADFLGIDDFEGYKGELAPLEEQIWFSWHDGLGYGGPATPPYYPGNNTGSGVGDEDNDTSYMEETIVHGGDMSMPYFYTNNGSTGKAYYSEAKLTLKNPPPRDWTEGGVKALSLWFQGYPASVGSFTDNFDGTYTMTASGTDIWAQADEFHFAYKSLSGPGSLIARVDSVDNTNAWAKAGVMIRDSLDPNSMYAFMCVSPTSGVAYQRRTDTAIGAVGDTVAGITAPQWVKIERELPNWFTASYSDDGQNWTVAGASEQIFMGSNVFIGLALTAHNASATCQAEFSNVQASVSGPWAHQDIGIQSNDPERIYVAIANSNGTTGTVYYDDNDNIVEDATQIGTWTEWNIDLKDFQDQNVNLADVNSIAIGIGTRGGTAPGGEGKMYFDDIRLYRPRCVPDKLTLSEADLNSDCVIDFRDLEIIIGDWLNAAEAPSVSPAGWWKFENNVSDSAGSNHGTAMGSPTYSAGIDGQAINLDGIDDYIDCGSDASLNVTEAVTIAAWIKLSGPGADQKIAGNQDGETGGYKFGVYNNLAEFEIRTSTNASTLNRSVSGGKALSPGVWYHVAGVYSQGDYIRTYVDGMLDRELATTAVLGSSTGPLIIGREPFNAILFFDGLIDDLRIYNHAMSASEIFSIAGGSPIDLNDDMKIDLKDHAVLADQWLNEQLWPE